VVAFLPISLFNLVSCVLCFVSMSQSIKKITTRILFINRADTQLNFVDSDLEASMEFLFYNIFDVVVVVVVVVCFLIH